MKEILFKPDEVKFLKFVLAQYNYPDKPICKKIISKLERAEKKIKVSSAKGKGRNLQYWVCKRIAKMFGIEFVQSDDDCLIQSRPMGQNGTDVILRGKIGKKFPFDIECKCCESLSIPEWVRQAQANKKENRDWLLVFKKQTMSHNPFVIMEWDCFEKLMSKIL